MFERSWKRALSSLRSSQGERVMIRIGVTIGYALLSFIGGVAAILWRIV